MHVNACMDDRYVPYGVTVQLLVCCVHRHLIPLLMKEGSVGLVGFYGALLSASMEHPGHAVLAQKVQQESEEPRHTAKCTCVLLTFCMLRTHHWTLRISKYPYGSSSLSLTYVLYVRICWCLCMQYFSFCSTLSYATFNQWSQ